MQGILHILHLPYSFLVAKQVTGGEEPMLIEERAGGSLSPLMLAVHKGGLAADFPSCWLCHKLQHSICVHI